MKAIEILKFIGECGGRFKASNLDDLISYIDLMLKDNRVLEIRQPDFLLGFMFFSICREVNLYYAKKPWDFVPHDPSGNIVYIEAMVIREWNKVLRKEIQKRMLALYPNLDTLIWHRYHEDGDRMITYRRKQSCMK